MNARPRLFIVLAALAGSAVCLAGASCARKIQPGDPIAGLTREQRDQFESGRKAFERTFTPETGLGPLFNADACAECHEDPVPGGPGDEVETHATAFDPNTGFCDPLAGKGGPVFQTDATPALREALGIDREPVPAEATGRGGRSSPDVLGFGLLDAVPAETILARADPDDRDGDGISGRPNYFFDGRLGRFGRKALVPTLLEFNEGAYPAEQGITTPGIPIEETIGGDPVPPGVDPTPEPELDAKGLALTDAFVRFSAPPAPKKLSKAARRGREVFAHIACVSCHVPTLKTGDSPVEALRYKEVDAYTDLLLHDMGPELADICLGQATPSEFRTEPLMGLRLSEIFMHDGRAGTIDEAIELHAGEATASRDKFRNLPSKDRKALIEFLEAL